MEVCRERHRMSEREKVRHCEADVGVHKQAGKEIETMVCPLEMI